VFALYVVIELGRSFSVMPEARRLVTNGPYSVIRHPVYLGEAVALAGVTSQYLSPWAPVPVSPAIHIPAGANEERGARAVMRLSGVSGLRGAHGSAPAGTVLSPG
jgi:protein-S-isoprenylcysteine O-methyltransferase Ste14